MMVIAAMVAVIGMAGTAQAVWHPWTGGGSDGLWNTPTNWNPAYVPVAGDEAYLPGGTVVSINNPGAPIDSRLYMTDATPGGTTTLHIAADIEWDWATVGVAPGAANVFHTTGTVFSSRYNDPSLWCFGLSGAPGTYEITGGKLQAYGEATIGAGAGSTGLLTLGGGVVQIERLTFNADADSATIDFPASSSGALYVTTADKDAAAMAALIAAGNITYNGGAASLSFFDITEVLAGDYAGYTEVKLGVVPEPAGLGLIGLALLAVRRKRN